MTEANAFWRHLGLWNIAPSYSFPYISQLRLWWRHAVVETVAHQDVIARINEEGGWSPRYGFMILMSAGIAVLGLLLSSPAVVIGAMLISPLMNPILGFGFSLATFDFRETRRSLTALAIGSSLAVAFTALIVHLSPLKEATGEILSRTRPNLFDLLVALFAALAGTVAIIRGQGGTIVGVAIATALMPPLAVVGYGLATWNMPVLGGSLALFVTNFVTIAISATIMARLYGFGRSLSSHQTWLHSALLVVVIAALTVPLALSLSRIAREAVTINEVRAYLTHRFGARSRVTQLSVDFDVQPIAIRSVVIAPRTVDASNAAIQTALQGKLGRPITLQLDQVLFAGASNGLEAQRAQLEASTSAAAAKTEADRVATAVALAAGAASNAVILDSTHRQATARSAALPGADLATYRSLEQRAAAATHWRVVIVPPLQALPVVRFSNGSDVIDEPAGQAILVSAWAAERWNAAALGIPGLTPAGGTPKRPRLDQRRALAVAATLKADGMASYGVPAAGPVFRLSLPSSPATP